MDEIKLQNQAEEIQIHIKPPIQVMFSCKINEQNERIHASLLTHIELWFIH